MMSKPILAAALTAATLLGAPFAAYADSGHGHGADQQDAQNGGEDEAHGESEGHGPSAMNAASPAGVWAELMAARDAIAADVENGELGSIHEKSEPLPELGAAFLEQSGDLDASKRARVEGALKQIGRIADVLHTAADGDDLARTRKALARLDGLLELIQVQYPAGMLDGGEDREHGHDGHSMAPQKTHGAHAHMQRPLGVVDITPRAFIRVRASDRLQFEPKRIVVRAGVPTRIELENVGAIEHALVVKMPDGDRDWVHIHVPPGVTDAATYQLDTPGSYPLLCTIPGHTEAGMHRRRSTTNLGSDRITRCILHGITAQRETDSSSEFGLLTIGR